MTDDRLQDLLDDAKTSYRSPPEPPLDAMWADIEARAFPMRAGWRGVRPTWTLFAAGLAAALLIGVGVGRLTTGPEAVRVAIGGTTPTPPPPPAVSVAYQRTASEFLSRSAVLLSALPADGRSDPQVDARISLQAGELLVTTRLLLDSPAATDRRFTDLLEDLELVLVQVARLRGARSQQDLDLITDALHEKDVVPRIHSAVAQMSAGAD
jgi:hypothetical protein